LKSPKNIIDPVIIYTYDGSPKKLNADNKSGANYAIAHAVETALEQIIEFNKQEGKPDNSSILLLGRFGFGGDKLE
jgi:DNA helicase-4